MKFKVKVFLLGTESYTCQVEAPNEDSINWEEVYEQAPAKQGYDIDDLEEPEVQEISHDPDTYLNTYEVTTPMVAYDSYTVEVEADNQEAIDWDYIYEQDPCKNGLEINDDHDPEVTVIKETFTRKSDGEVSVHVDSKAGDIFKGGERQLDRYKSVVFDCEYFLDKRADVHLPVYSISKITGECEGRIAAYLDVRYDVTGVYNTEQVLDVIARFKPKMYMEIDGNLLGYLLGVESHTSNQLDRRVDYLEKQVKFLTESLELLTEYLVRVQTKKG